MSKTGALNRRHKNSDTLTYGRDSRVDISCESAEVTAPGWLISGEH